MIINTTLDGRPVKVLFINRAFEPVEQDKAELVRVNFMDDEGGSMFLVPSHDDDETKEFDPSKHPRVPAGSPEGGRFGHGSSGSGSSDPRAPGDDKQLLISHGPPQERLEHWAAQIAARQKELENAGLVGSDLDNNLQKMSIALQTWANTSAEDRRSGKWGISVVYNYPPELETSTGDSTRLQAIVTAQFNEATRVALTEGKGGIDHDAMVKAFKMTITDYSESHSAVRIENNEFADDHETISAAEEAGFRRIGGTGGGVQQMIWGQEETTAKPPSFEHLPVPVELSEGTGTDFQSEIAAAVASIPARALKTMADGGIKIRAGKKLTDLRPDLKGVHPRGWPAGTTWDSADGMFDRASKTVFVTELYRPIGSKEFKPGSRPRGVVLHESGHAFDLALDAPSRTSKAFASAYADDVKALPKGSKNRLGYFLQKKHEAGRVETFAEIFGQYAGAGSSRNDIRPSFPRTSVLVKEAMIRGLWLEPIA